MRSNLILMAVFATLALSCGRKGPAYPDFPALLRDKLLQAADHLLREP